MLTGSSNSKRSQLHQPGRSAVISLLGLLQNEKVSDLEAIRWIENLHG